MKKGKWILLAVVLCLGLIGGAYAAWTQELVITGNVETAEFDVYFDKDRKGDGASDEAVEWAGVTHSINDDLDTLTFNMTNGFPHFWYNCYVDIVNDSSIPVYVKYIVGGQTPLNDGDFYVQVQNRDGSWLEGEHIPPGEKATICLNVVVGAHAEKGAEADFEVKLEVYQYGY